MLNFQDFFLHGEETPDENNETSSLGDKYTLEDDDCQSIC